jgi:hypothetical protein
MLELVKSGKKLDAIAYARKHLTPAAAATAAAAESTESAISSE